MKNIASYVGMSKGMVIAFALTALFFLSPALASAQQYYYVPSNQYTYTSGTYGSSMNQEQLIKFLQQLIIQLQAQIANRNHYTPGYQYPYGHDNKDNYVVGEPRGYHDDDDEPDVETEGAKNIEEDEAELRGFVDMNDFEDGEVFFVYGEDEDQVEDIEDDYDSYSDVDEDGDDLQKVRVDSSFDDDDDFEETVFGLDEDTDYFFQICVGYEDEDDDEVIKCGGVEEFTTGDEGSGSSNDEPDVTTEDAENIEEDEAEMHGEVDMNDFNNGEVFFVYGEDEDQVEDIEDDYDSYSDVDEDGDDLQKVRMDSDLDSQASYELTVSGLDEDTDYFFQICVGYEDEDDDDVIKCGGVEEFTTDED